MPQPTKPVAALLRTLIAWYDTQNDVEAIPDWETLTQVVEQARVALQPSVPTHRAEARISARDFFDRFKHAKRTIYAENPQWHLDRGLFRMITVPSGWRTIPMGDGYSWSLGRDLTIPIAEFWPGGEYPDGVEPREDLNRAIPGDPYPEPRRIAAQASWYTKTQSERLSMIGVVKIDPALAEAVEVPVAIVGGWCWDYERPGATEPEQQASLLDRIAA